MIWEGVRLAPAKWPGRDKVLALAATLKLMFGVEFSVALRPGSGKRVMAKYMDLPLDKQVQFYSRFKDFYDLHIQRTLNA